MFLDPNDPRLGDVPGLVYRSFWPSQDTLLDGKVKEILESGLGAESVLQSALGSNYDALRIALRNKATVVGDFLSKQLATVASFKASPAGQVLQGVFANVEWGSVRDNPEQALTAMLRVGVPAALTVLTSVPIAGQLAAAYFAIGLKLADMFSQPDPLMMPWSEYSRDTDEDLTSKVVLGIYSKSVDQTNLFRPPFDPKAGWRMGVAGDAKKPRGYVWAPWQGGEIPWRSDGVGSIPGTLRMFGQIQLTAPRVHPPELDRYVRAAKGFTPRDRLLRWPSTKTNCGDFYPGAAQACGILGSMNGTVGAPDMYKVHVPLLMDEWRLAFESLEASFADLWNTPAGLMKDVGAIFVSGARQLLSDAQSPWVAVRVTPSSEWVLGVPWEVPSDWGMIVPEIYSGGLPGDPAGRTPSLWIEEDTPRNARHPGWPYGSKPRQHGCAKHKACSSDLAAVVDPEVVRGPAEWRAGQAPKGYRRVPWPPPEADAAEYASPWKVIIKPALERLRLQQERALKTTLVCAYVRPEETGGLPAYGAFRDPELRQLCKSMREILLTHPLRYRVDLKDVEAVDPAFAVRLKQSGVTGSVQDFSKSLGFASDALVVGSEAPPENRAPQGGIPFADELARVLRDPGRLARLAKVVGGALAVAGAGYVTYRALRKG